MSIFITKSIEMLAQRIVIFGCGWLGLPLAQNLVAKGAHVVGTTTSEEKKTFFSDLGIQPLVLKVGDAFNQAEFLVKFKPEILVIAYPLGSRRMNENEHLDHVKWIAEHLIFPDLKQIILMSSTSVYPDTDGEMTELNVLRPSGSGLRQLEFEEELRKIVGSKLVVLRLAGLIDEVRHPGNFLAGKINLPNGKSPVNLVHRDDVIAFVNCVLSAQTTNEIFNVCADEHPEKAIYYTKMSLKIGQVPPQFNSDLPSNGKLISNLKGKLSFGVSYSKGIYSV